MTQPHPQHFPVNAKIWITAAELRYVVNFCTGIMTDGDIRMFEQLIEELHQRGKLEKEHDAAIRKDEREKVLDELLQWLDGHWTLTMVNHYGAWTTQQSLEYKTTINKVKSLCGGA